ncbi:hypothetical protein VN91_0725 [Lactococcus lactis subsp. lactis]|nr:hypothetical protein VN91_0725 [Lactococcus lactis subsp. lactis]
MTPKIMEPELFLKVLMIIKKKVFMHYLSRMVVVLQNRLKRV